MRLFLLTYFLSLGVSMNKLLHVPELTNSQLHNARACLKKAFCELRIPVCGGFRPNEGGVAGLRQPNKGKIYRKVGLADRRNVFSNTL